MTGDHRVRVTVTGGTVAGIAGRQDLILDKSVNRWHTAGSDLGVIELGDVGAKTLSLKLKQRDRTAELGPTVCRGRLAPVPAAG